MNCFMERARGIEPPSHAWQARILTIILRPQHYYDNKIDGSCQLLFLEFYDGREDRI